jgi:hypothetical protein
VTKEAARIGPETLEMWNQLVARAQAEVRARDA